MAGSNNSYYCHPLSDVHTEDIGKDTHIWQFVVVLQDARIGRKCNISCHVFIENDVRVGNEVTIKSGVQLWDGLRVEDHVFIGPNVTFTNDKNPRSKQYPEDFQQIHIHHHASIGAGATVLGGTEIGPYAMVGAGALVTKDVPERALVVGQPARIVGWVNDDGTKMEERNGFWIDSNKQKWMEDNKKLVKA